MINDDDSVTLSPSIFETAELRRRSRRRGARIFRIAFIVGVLLVVAAAVAAFVPISDYAITPGDALNVSALIGVPKSDVHDHRGAVLLTDVSLIQLSALEYLYYRFDNDASIYPSSQIIGPLTASEYNEQGVIDMVVAREDATVVALRTLGYKITPAPAGVAVYQQEPTSPTLSHLAIGDVITAVDGVSVPSLQALHSALVMHQPGQQINVTYHVVSSTTVRHASITLGSAVVSANGNLGACKPMTKTVRSGEACLGIYIQQLVIPQGEPFSVSIDADGIVGPSAGLAFTLGLIQKLDRLDLTNGQKVAATGTMSLSGVVGDVGGVAQKTVAVRNAGATVFFVPKVEYQVARAHAGPGLRIVSVSTIGQAISALEDLGGRVSRP